MIKYNNFKYSLDCRWILINNNKGSLQNFIFHVYTRMYLLILIKNIFNFSWNKLMMNIFESTSFGLRRRHRQSAASLCVRSLENLKCLSFFLLFIIYNYSSIGAIWPSPSLPTLFGFLSLGKLLDRNEKAGHIILYRRTRMYISRLTHYG